MTDIVELVKTDLEARAVVGERKYGARLTTDDAPHNGLTPLENAYEELLDLVTYLRHELSRPFPCERCHD